MPKAVRHQWMSIRVLLECIIVKPKCLQSRASRRTAGISGDASVVCFTLLERSTTDTRTCQPYRGRDIPGLLPNRSYILTFK